MNIFPIEYDRNGNIDWELSANSQDNYRVVKMILESAQMLCTALNELSGEQIATYRSTHKNHPSNKWVRASSANWLTLHEHCWALCREYRRRFKNKTHKCEAVLDDCMSKFDESLFPDNKITQLPLCMPDEFKSDDVVDSYRRYYASKPRMRYPKDKIPKWFIKYRNNVPFDAV